MQTDVWGFNAEIFIILIKTSVKHGDSPSSGRKSRLDFCDFTILKLFYLSLSDLFNILGGSDQSYIHIK